MGKVTYGVKWIRNQVTNISSDLLNLIINNPESVVEVVSAYIDYSLIQLFTDQSSPCQTRNARQWKVSPKLLKWSDITPEEMKMFLGLIILMVYVRKDNMRDYWSTDPTISIPVFLSTVSGNRFEAI
jgi:hypothetical protein